MGPFKAAQGWGGKKAPLAKIRHYPIMMKLGLFIPYLKKIQKIYKSRDRPIEFCWCQHFFRRKSGNFVISRNKFKKLHFNI